MVIATWTANSGIAEAVQWDAQTGKRLNELNPGHSLATSEEAARDTIVSAIALSTDARRMVTVLGNQSAVIWDTETGSRLQTLKGIGNSIVAMSPDGSRLLTGSSRWQPESPAGLWDLDNGERLHVFDDFPPDSSVYCVGFSADGNRLVMTSSNRSTADPSTIARSISVRDVESGTELRRFEHENQPTWTALTPDGRQVILAFPSRWVACDVETGDELRTFDAPEDAYAAVVGNVWDAATRAVHQTYQKRYRRDWRPTGSPIVRFTPEGIPYIGGVRSPVTAFHHGGHLSVVATADPQPCTVIWDELTEKSVRRTKHGMGEADSLAFSSNGDVILSGGFDGTVRFTDVTTGDEIGRLIALRENDWLVVTPEGLYDGSETGRGLVTYRLGGEMKVVPAERMGPSYHRPGLLAELLRGERPMPDDD